MEVSSGGVEAAVTEQDLDGPQVGAGFQEVSGEAVTKRVHSNMFVQSCGEAGCLTGEIHRLVGEGPIGGCSREEPGAGLVHLAAPVGLPVFAEQGEQAG